MIRRTLAVVGILLLLALGYQLNRIHQRHNFLNEQVQRGNAIGTLTMFTNAPGVLGAFGESGYKSLGIFADEETTADEMKRAMALFPEATIGTVKRPSAFSGSQF